MTPQELINKGIEVIQRDGWYQGGIYQPPTQQDIDNHGGEYVSAAREAGRTAPVCAKGSLYRAALGTAYISEAIDALTPCEIAEVSEIIALATFRMEKAIMDLSPDRPELPNVPHFNDRVAQSVEDVLLMMKEAAR